MQEVALKEAASWEATLKEVASGPLSGCGDCGNKHRFCDCPALCRAGPGLPAVVFWKYSGFGALPGSRPTVGTLLKLCGAADFKSLQNFRSAWPADLKFGRLLKPAAPHSFKSVPIFGLFPGKAPKPEYFENTAAQPPWLGSAEAASKEASMKEASLKEASLKSHPSSVFRSAGERAETSKDP